MSVTIDPKAKGVIVDFKTGHVIGYGSNYTNEEPAPGAVDTATASKLSANASSSEAGGKRETTAQIVFDGTDISKDISPYILSVAYTDNEEGETDDLQISMQDRDQIWMSKWLDAAVNAALKPRTPDTPGEDGKITSATVNAKSGLILRAGKSKQTKRLTAAPFGTVIKVTDPTGDWWACEYAGMSGYMWYSYLTPAPKTGGTDGQAGSDGSASGGASGGSTVNRGFPITATLKTAPGGQILECGEFELDSVDASGSPSVINVKASSLPFSAPIRQTKKTKAWEAYELKGIGAEIAANAGMAFQYLADDNNPTLAREEQSEESDIEFYSRITKQHGLSLKCSNNSIVVFDQKTYEAIAPVLTITRGDGSYLKYKLNTGQAGTKYTSARVSYTTPEGQLIEGIAKTAELEEKEAKDAASGKTKSDAAAAKEQAKNDAQRLEIHQKVESIGEAKELAEKYLRMHNKFSKTGSFTFKGNPVLVAGATIDLKNFGPWSGKYIIKQAKHTLNTSGYTTQISLRNILEAY